MYTELRTFTKDSLTAKLKEISKIAEEKREAELIESNTDFKITEVVAAGDEARKAFLSTLFGGRNVFSLFSTETTVYVDTPDEAIEVIKEAEGIGFKNIGTYIPLVCDGNGGSKPDPKNNIAVNIKASEEQIFGNASQNMIKMFSQFVDVVKDEVVYTYCYNGDYSLTFRNEEVANVLCDKLNQFMELMNKQMLERKLDELQYSVTVRPEHLDRFIVHIKLKAF